MIQEKNNSIQINGEEISLIEKVIKLSRNNRPDNRSHQHHKILNYIISKYGPLTVGAESYEFNINDTELILDCLKRYRWAWDSVEELKQMDLLISKINTFLYLFNDVERSSIVRGACTNKHSISDTLSELFE